MDDKLKNMKLNDDELDMVSGGTDDMISVNIGRCQDCGFSFTTFHQTPCPHCGSTEIIWSGKTI